MGYRDSISGRYRDFYFPSRPAPEPIQRRIQWLSRAPSSGIKTLGREAEHPPQFSAEVKNAWSYTYLPMQLCSRFLTCYAQYEEGKYTNFHKVLIWVCQLYHFGLTIWAIHGMLVMTHDINNWQILVVTLLWVCRKAVPPRGRRKLWGWIWWCLASVPLKIFINFVHLIFQLLICEIFFCACVD
jgi:hypothetical protein